MRTPGSRRSVIALTAGVLGGLVLVALLTAAGHGSARRALSARPAAAARPAHRTCAPGSGATGGATPALARSFHHALDEARARTHTPAATAAVVVCGHVLWAGATGVLALGSRRPATDRTLFIINSSVKTLVATMVLREIQDGELTLGTKLAQFFPALPNARRITIEDLLDMESGLPDYLYTARVEAMMRLHPRHRWTVGQVLTALGGGLGAPAFAPGRRFQYSDTNYIALGAIVERITHRSIQSDFEQLIERPAGFSGATFVPTAAAKALMAHPYVAHDGPPVGRWIPGFGLPTVLWGPVFTDGGLAASSLDLARFGNALLGDRLIDRALVGRMTRIRAGNYGFGIRSRSFAGRTWLGHRGYWDGFDAEDWSDPSRQVTIATETNLDNLPGVPSSTSVWMAITRVYNAYAARARHVATT